MKLSFLTGSKKRHGQNGAGLLLAVLFFAGVFIAAYLATYLTVVRNEYTFVARSQNWNTSLVLAEAGVEDGMAFINQNANGAVGTLGDWPSSASANGWSNVPSANTALYPSVYTITRQSIDTNTGYYTVWVTNNSTPGVGPTILSIGTATWKDSTTTYIAAGNNSRKVLVDTAGYSQGSEGIIAYSTMDYKGSQVQMDSFDSADPNHSIWQTTLTYHGMPYGLYSDSLSYSSNTLPSRTSEVVVATDGTLLNIQNATIYGFAQTGTGGFPPTAGSKGVVGDLNYASNAGNDGTIQPGHGRDDMNEIFYSKSLPDPTTNGWQTNWLGLPATMRANAYFKIGGTWTNVAGIGWTNVGGTKYQADSSGGANLPTPGAPPGTTAYYQTVITNMPANTNLVFYDVSSISGNVFVDAPYTVLWCSNGVSLKGNSLFTVNTNSDLTIYSEGGFSDGGNGTFNNGSDYAKALSIYDVSGNGEAIAFNGGGIGSAYIFAPSSTVSFKGGAGGTYGFVGALFCDTVTITGNYNFHFDEVFDQTTASDQFLPTLWQEVQ